MSTIDVLQSIAIGTLLISVMLSAVSISVIRDKINEEEGDNEYEN